MLNFHNLGKTPVLPVLPPYGAPAIIEPKSVALL